MKETRRSVLDIKQSAYILKLNGAFYNGFSSFRQKLEQGCQDHFREVVENTLVVVTIVLVEDLE